MRLYNTLTRSEEEFVPADGRTVRMYTLRADGVCARAHRQFPDVRQPGCAAARAEVPGRLRDAPRHELHGRGRQDDHRVAAGRRLAARLHDRYVAAFLEDAAAMGLEPVEENPRATDEANLRAMADMVNALTARGHTYQSDGSDLLPDRDAARLRQAGAAGPRRHSGRRARRRGHLHQAGRPRLRAVEGHQARRAHVGLRVRARAAGLAHRVLGDGAATAWPWRRSTSTAAAST